MGTLTSWSIIATVDPILAGSSLINQLLPFSSKRAHKEKIAFLMIDYIADINFYINGLGFFFLEDNFES
jgi:hypothetical protein